MCLYTTTERTHSFYTMNVIFILSICFIHTLDLFVSINVHAYMHIAYYAFGLKSLTLERNLHKYDLNETHNNSTKFTKLLYRADQLCYIPVCYNGS